MVTISLCMIVKDEEEILARCLDCVADLMDEIIIVDTGSTDKTKEIARRYTDKIYDFKWENDFSAARNFAFSKATALCRFKHPMLTAARKTIQIRMHRSFHFFFPLYFFIFPLLAFT